jgi:phage-related protein
MKPIRFLGDSLKALRAFPTDARQNAGYQLEKVQNGKAPNDSKPMPSIGKGVEEIRVWHESGTHRVIYGPVERACLCSARFSEEDASVVKT